MEIKSTFESVIEFGYYVRKTEKNGLQEWRLLRDHIDGIDTFVINNEFKMLCESLNYNKEENDNDHQRVKIIVDDVTYNNESLCDHFFIQLFRIPRMENYNLSTVKLLQLAYNIGQLKYEIDRNKHCASAFFDEHKLGLLETYIGKK